MPEKTKEPQKEIPLHEVVLKLMFEENIEKPAELLPNEVFWAIADADLTERNIAEVLNWLVSKNRVEEFKGKYYLERIEFLKFRNVDRGIVVLKNEVSGGALKKKSNATTSDKEEVPLHEILLKIMFDASKEKPAELSVNDIFWKSSDPLLRESKVDDVLKWLLHHRRVEYRAGKYSLDQFEFLEQTKNDRIRTVKGEDKPKKKEKKKGTEVSEPAVKKTPTIITPSAPEEMKISSPEKTPKPKELANIPKRKETKSTIEPVEPKSKVVPEVKITPETVEPKSKVVTEVKEDRKVNTALLLIATCFFAYTCYLLISMSNLTTTLPSKQLQREIVSVQSELKQLSEKESTADNKFKIVEERLMLIQGMTLKQSEQISNQNDINSSNTKRIITRLVVSNSILLLLIFTTLFYWKNKSRFFNK